MKTSEMIEKIENEMCCANDCPQYHKAHYDGALCTCYKWDVLEDIRNKSTLVYAVEEFVDGSVTGRWAAVGSVFEFTSDWNLALHFSDTSSAIALKMYLHEISFSDLANMVVTEHKEF